MKKNALISILLCISITFYGLFYVNVRQAKAYPVSASFANLVAEIGTFVSQIGDTAANMGTLGQTISKFVWDMGQAALKIVASQAIVAAKVLALLAVQKVTAMIIGTGDGLIIRDWNNYLYTSPQQTAMKQMDSFFTSTSKGRLSSLNYEGVGPNYDAYLVTQAKQMISSSTPATNIQEKATNPTTDMFSGGNMQAVVAAMQCTNNVPCYTLMATDKYTTEVAKAQDVAKSSQQNGILPTKTADGRIIKPSALISNSLMELDNMGTNLIMTAQADGTTSAISALTQIAEGSALSIAARAINYGISDNNGKAAVVAQNSKFPFSLSYNSGNIKIK